MLDRASRRLAAASKRTGWCDSGQLEIARLAKSAFSRYPLNPANLQYHVSA
jgi:hypothetical protein